MAKEETDESFDFAVQSVWMETAHYTESDYVWIDYILFHLLAIREFSFVVDFKLCILCNTLYDRQRNLLVLFCIAIVEVFIS